ncbi:MAG: Gfo/Idh/MocA family oxidoreductase [Spirochaetota bacterium]|nr:Gfo/Idh/MocA family oxidoreductase [Spirochaetota bacterium]
MKPLNIALIGCGRIGFSLEFDPLRYKPCTHWGGANSVGLRINYACDINVERLNRFASCANLSKENLFADYKELIERVNPKFVIISTWTESHADIGIFASKNGAKTIICEKPIASTLSQAQLFIKSTQRYNVDLIVNHERRYDNRYRMVRRLIDNGRIGEVKTIYASILTSGYNGESKIEEGGGPLLHDGTHMIDIIRFLFGEINSVEGEIERKERESGFEDRVCAWLKCSSGIDIFLEAGGEREYFLFELEISGTKGKIVIGNGYEHLYQTKKSRLYTGFRDLSEKSFPKTGGPNYFQREYLEAKKLLNGKIVDIISSGEDGYKALEVIHAIYLSSHLKKRIELPIKPAMINLKRIFGL